ncbi:hypothetical protein L198_07177 [Cryptococcus wingfieldii CBS 7118]|uniref:Uncharacterized protein n=1 Tax=Cryptococcus wingfieldii CBS 7118 TaxID=1295528 RepID=A0A1E3IEG0_9TREE|nr:hypothetical protein L198_07177 [Cryptococcus wingfieldii CBS 7118]ODN86815.1 hypothetical protein L198_07177 [Cryptococcus wingfieldii CBS 7118]
MPLFKLTSKRIQKRQREDELGITELKAKMREAGEDVPDSEDELSGEDSDEEDGSDDEGEEEEEDEDEDEEGGSDAEGSESGLKRKRSGSESSLGSEEEEYDDEEDRLDLTPEEALQTPIYAFAPPPSSSDDEDVEGKDKEESDEEVDDSKMQKLCALCPGKVMKNEHMVEMHLASNAHKRSAKRYEAHLDAHNPSPDTDPRTIALSLLPSHSAPAPKAEKTEKKKKKSVSKKDRLTARLAKAQQSVSTTLEQQPEKLDAEKLKEVVEGKGLNRKAKRALVARLKEEGRLVVGLGEVGEKGEKKEKPTAKKAKKD